MPKQTMNAATDQLNIINHALYEAMCSAAQAVTAAHRSRNAMLIDATERMYQAAQLAHAYAQKESATAFGDTVAYHEAVQTITRIEGPGRGEVVEAEFWIDEPSSATPQQAHRSSLFGSGSFDSLAGYIGGW